MLLRLCWRACAVYTCDATTGVWGGGSIGVMVLGDDTLDAALAAHGAGGVFVKMAPKRPARCPKRLPTPLLECMPDRLWNL